MDSHYNQLRRAIVLACEGFSMDTDGAGRALAETNLCVLAQRLSRNLDEVTMNAARARVEVESNRDDLLSKGGDSAVIWSRSAELLADLDAIEARKRASIETELVAVDSNLEHLQREIAEIVSAARSLGDTEFFPQVHTLNGRLNALQQRLRLHQPLEPVEPTGILFRMLASQNIGEVVSVSCMSATSLAVQDVPRYARPGEPLRFSVRAMNAPPLGSELEDGAVGKLARLLRVHATVDGADEAEGCSIYARMSVSSDHLSVLIDIPVPSATPLGSFVSIESIFVAGHIDACTPGLPLKVAVVGGVAPHTRVEGVNGYNTRPCSSPEGKMFLADEGAPSMRVLSSTGAVKEVVDVTALGLSLAATVVAFDSKTDTLLIADKNGRRSKLVSVCPRTYAVKWTAGSFNDCVGIAILSQHGVAVACSYQNNALHVHRLADGARIATAMTLSPSDISADPSTGTVYVACDGNDGDIVASWVWCGKKLTSRGPVDAAGVMPSRRLVTVVPPSFDRSASYLVVGTTNSRSVCVLSLPDLRLIGNATLPDTLTGDARARGAAANVWGIVACASGTALMVCRPALEHCVNVEAWPLVGLPELL